MYNKNENIKTRVSRAVDVSGSFDNCFFHNYALYLLTNHQAFPKDFFNFKSLLDNSKAERLARYFPNQKSLDDIALLNSAHDPSVNYLFEKTLLLGFLLREWLPTQLMEHPELGNDMLEGESGVLNCFKNYKEYREFMPKEELSTSQFSVLYEANEAFLEYLCQRAKGQIDLNSPFEAYFAHASSEKEAIRTYWNIEGYPAYCRYMAQPQVKISPIEIMAMMKVINQPLTIYDRSNASIIGRHHNQDVTSPPFEVALAASEGHYFLLKTAETADDVQKYEQSHQLYKKDRDELLSRSEKSVTSLFARATCPKGDLDNEPFDALIDQVSVLEHLRPQPEIQRPEPVAQNTSYNFLLNLGAAVVGTSAALVTLMGVAILTDKYDPGVSLLDEAVATSVVSGVVGLGYSLYRFFSPQQPAKNLEPQLEYHASYKQKLD